MRVLIGCATSCVALNAFLARGEDAREVVGFPAYVVTNHGRVISLKSGAAREMKPRPHRGGYKIVTFCADGEQATFTIHRVVAEAFIPNPEGLPIVRHLDGNRANNAAENLAWGTYAQNEADKIAHGTRRYGTAKMKLNASARARVLAMSRDGAPSKRIAEHFNVNRSTITRLIAGATWTNRRWPMAEEAANR
jgi:hypothetical protein